MDSSSDGLGAGCGVQDVGSGVWGLGSGVMCGVAQGLVTLSVAEGSPADWQMTIVSLCALFIFLLSPYNAFLTSKPSLL